MTELFAPSLDDQIECVTREIRMRQTVYPRRVADKKMTQAMADRETGRMLAVLESLHRLKGLEK